MSRKRCGYSVWSVQGKPMSLGMLSDFQNTAKIICGEACRWQGLRRRTRLPSRICSRSPAGQPLVIPGALRRNLLEIDAVLSQGHGRSAPDLCPRSRCSWMPAGLPSMPRWQIIFTFISRIPRFMAESRYPWRGRSAPAQLQERLAAARQGWIAPGRPDLGRRIFLKYLLHTV